MDTLLQPPVATAFDAFAGVVAAALYVLVGVAALARAPRDVRTRLFLFVALCSVAPYGITMLMYLRGSGAAFTRPIVAVTVVSLMLGSLALLHFMQVFPWRRPLIRACGRWVPAAYAAVVLAAAVALWVTRGIVAQVSGDVAGGAGGLGSVSVGLEESLALLAIVLPSIFLLGVVVPFVGLMSLYQSWQEATRAGLDGARRTTLWMLISQLAGGVLTILVIPLLRFVAPSGPWVTIASALLFGFGILMPIAFAAAVWKFQLIDQTSMA